MYYLVSRGVTNRPLKEACTNIKMKGWKGVGEQRQENSWNYVREGRTYTELSFNDVISRLVYWGQIVVK